MNILQINIEYVSYTIHTYQLSTEASAMSSLFKIYLCSLISMPLFVKAIALKRTSVAISSLIKLDWPLTSITIVDDDG